MKSELASYAKLVEGEIGRYIKGDPDSLFEPMRDLFSRGGKRIRPALCIISCEAVGGKKEKAIKAASFIEMVHNFTLIHDDIADKSELRRGKPCLHHTYGLGFSINVGDGLFSRSYETLSDAVEELEDKKAKKVFRDMSAAITKVCGGQARDISWAERKIWDLDEEDYFTMIRGKTGALIEASCELGAVIGGADEKQLTALKNFGMDIGVAFQIHDDVLNLRGDESKYGKEIGGDINEGKRTLMVIYTLNACTPSEKKRLISILDKERNSESEIKEAIDILKKYGSIDRAAEIAKDIIGDGKKGLAVLPESKSKSLLLKIADYMIERDL